MRFKFNYGATVLGAVMVFCGISAVGYAGENARLVTVRDTLEDNGRDHVKVRLPALAGTGNRTLEERINRQIRTTMENAVKDAQRKVNEYRAAQLATGGTPEHVIATMIDIDYELKHCSEHRISFVVYKTQTLANAYTQQMFFNLELPGGRELSLRELLGEKYRAIADAEIRRQMAERSRRDGAVFFEAGQPGAFQTISDRQPFYLNKAGEVVIVFGKYEIAPGSMGILEFVIATAQ